MVTEIKASNWSNNVKLENDFMRNDYRNKKNKTSQIMLILQLGSWSLVTETNAVYTTSQIMLIGQTGWWQIVRELTIGSFQMVTEIKCVAAQIMLIWPNGFMKNGYRFSYRASQNMWIWHIGSWWRVAVITIHN